MRECAVRCPAIVAHIDSTEWSNNGCGQKTLSQLEKDDAIKDNKMQRTSDQFPAVFNCCCDFHGYSFSTHQTGSIFIR